jgi:aspartyl-tRNA(Asn)/glutamyl-tRNA(Gln) amidotransferase subunit C
MLRLRPDDAAPTATLAQRQALMANSPAEDDGLFLVPTVIE